MNFVIRSKTSKDKSTERVTPLLLKPPYTVYAHTCAMCNAASHQKVPILKKTLLCFGFSPVGVITP